MADWDNTPALVVGKTKRLDASGVMNQCFLMHAFRVRMMQILNVRTTQ